MPLPAPHASAVAQSAHSSSRRPENRRPATIAELAELARDTTKGSGFSLKQLLKTAEKHRRCGYAYLDKGELELGFIELARAATLCTDWIPRHKDYQLQLSAGARQNLGFHAQGILDRLGQAKADLIDRYDRWEAAYPEEAAQVAAGTAPPRTDLRLALSRAQEDERRREEADLWQRDASARRIGEERRYAESRAGTNPRELDQLSLRSSSEDDAVKLRDAMAAVRLAADGASTSSQSLVRQGTYDHARGNAAIVNQRREDAIQQQEEMKRRQEEIARRKLEERRKHEQEGIARRQQESETAAHAIRHSYPLQQLPTPAALTATSSTSVDPSPRALQMPLETPRGDDVSDSESFRTLGRSANAYDRNAYPAPITTTSPPPFDKGALEYPKLMTKHQRMQGYTPSLASMFSDSMRAPPVPQSLLFVPESRGPSSYSSASSSSHLPSTLYSSTALARISAPSEPMPLYPPPTANEMPRHNENTPQPPGAYPSQSAPAPPSTRITRSLSRRDPVAHELKTVNLPRDCLPRFLSIAALNTAQNRETCGLLLGKDRGNKYVVTTLLIPKQHSTSDTCTMDEEELVLQFTEERSLITLGWIHTHPSQSCFMSSVDLHTHSAFQRMLPESFAVVCAPKSNPKYGIFRLTNPPGLQIILHCTHKDAFHPHPDQPIYTDADKGHVVMKDASLEIVDLR